MVSQSASESFYKSESLYRKLVENSCDIIFSLTTKGKVTFVSPACRKILAIEPIELFGRSFFDSLHPDDAEPLQSVFRTLSEADHFLEIPCRIRHQDGTWVLFALRLTIHCDEIGLQSIIGIARDMTEHARMDELMFQSEKMNMLSGLVAGMAHELNNPLGSIMQHAQNIERRVSPEIPANLQASEAIGVSLDQVRLYLEKRGILQFISHIRTAGSQASRIITQLMQFVRRGETLHEVIDINRLMDESLALALTDYDMKKKYSFSSIEIVKEYAPSSLPVRVNLIEMEQVLLNILVNAAQALGDMAELRKPQITLKSVSMGRYAELSITDNGPGMDDETRRRIFDPFFSTKPVGAGTGLGLTVAYAIVTKGYNGMIKVDSKKDKGTCFTLQLPLAGKNQ